MKVEFYPEDNVYHVRLETSEERLAMSAFHSLITKTPTIEITPSKRREGYTVEIPDNFMETLDKQKKEFKELVEQNPHTRIYKTTG
jgi:hypothetical protein